MSDEHTQERLGKVEAALIRVEEAHKRVDDKLGEIRDDVGQTLSALKEHAQRDERQFDKIALTMSEAFGGKDRENPGIFTRLHLLEAFRSRVMRIGSWWGGIISGLVLLIASILAARLL